MATIWDTNEALKEFIEMGPVQQGSFMSHPYFFDKYGNLADEFAGLRMSLREEFSEIHKDLAGKPNDELLHVPEKTEKRRVLPPPKKNDAVATIMGAFSKPAGPAATISFPSETRQQQQIKKALSLPAGKASLAKPSPIISKGPVKTSGGMAPVDYPDDGNWVEVKATKIQVKVQPAWKVDYSLREDGSQKEQMPESNTVESVKSTKTSSASSTTQKASVAKQESKEPAPPIKAAPAKAIQPQDDDDEDDEEETEQAKPSAGVPAWMLDD